MPHHMCYHSLPEREGQNYLTKSDMSDLNLAFAIVQGFTQNATGKRIAEIEGLLKNATRSTSTTLLTEANINTELLQAALTMKQALGQIGEIVHALGILLALPSLLQENEVVEHLSLAAGNTGRLFDLETNQRVAEFKFNQWQGGAESIRQNQLFKDFYYLVEHCTTKEKYLYTTGTKHPLRFFQGRRALSSIMSNNKKLREAFSSRHGEKYTTIHQYYADHQTLVHLETIDTILPIFLREALSEE